MRILVWCFAFVLSASLTTPGLARQAPCSQPEADALDFWVGEWTLTWPGGQGGTPKGKEGRGSNVITRALGECVVVEKFESEAGFEGMSVSVYDANAGMWRQTWVDNSGGYLAFTGGMKDGQMELRMAPFTNAQGQEQINRMRWRDVKASSLRWDWQRSLDGGATWEDQWNILYTRNEATR